MGILREERNVSRAQLLFGVDIQESSIWLGAPGSTEAACGVQHAEGKQELGREVLRQGQFPPRTMA